MQQHSKPYHTPYHRCLLEIHLSTSSLNVKSQHKQTATSCGELIETNINSSTPSTWKEDYSE